MKPEKWLSLVLSLSVFGAAAQLLTDPDWREAQAPAPPAFNKDRLIALEMPRYVSLRFGVDPATLAITPDGIVRYVMVATNATGSVSALYEGIRCATGEVKTYARGNNGAAWSIVKDAQWQDWSGSTLASKHAKALARQGACDGSASANSVRDIVNALKNPDQGRSR